MTRQSQPMQPGSEQFTEESHRQDADDRIHRSLRAAIGNSDDPGIIIRSAVDALAEFAGYSLVAAYHVRDDGLHLLHQVGYDYPVRWFDMDSSICARVAKTGHGLLVTDVESEPAYVPVVEGVRSDFCFEFGVGDV